MFCYQPKFFKATKEVTEEQFWALVDAPYTKECIDKFRETGDAAWKKKLPAFIFQATFDETISKNGYLGRWRKQAATRLNGLVVLDVDHVDDCRAALTSMTEKVGTPDTPSTCKELGILLVYITPSGHGLKIVFKADVSKGNLIDNMLWMAKRLGVKADESCKDASRMSFACKTDDIIYINKEELFTYENKEFADKWNEKYRGGQSQPTLPFSDDSNVGDSVSAAGSDNRSGEADNNASGQNGTSADASQVTYRGLKVTDIVKVWLEGINLDGNRHNTLLKLAYQLRYVCENNQQQIESVLKSLPWVQDLEKEGDPVAQTIGDAMKRQMYQKFPKELQAVIARLQPEQEEQDALEVESQLPLRKWGEAISDFSKDYPCIKESLTELQVTGYAAGLFAAAAFFGTLMTRCSYRFYHRPEEIRRLNYCVMIIGDPASGKSFATRLHKLIAAPITTSDKVGYDAINRYKSELRTKGANKEKPQKPTVIIRDHPARTANGVFITDMNNAVEIIDGEPVHLHLLTFDSELDNATLMGKGGQWIDKSSLELKAFHNEEDGQAYANSDSISGTFNVYWNFVYTGTPLSLDRKVNETNFGSGLATRLGVIPLPPSKFKMMALEKKTTINHAADEMLKTWAFKLDSVKGELPLWPLVEHTWNWCNERMAIAEYNADKGDEMLIKRVPYYGIAVATPFIVMRHWEEWNASNTLTIDDRDRELCSLVMDIQYHCQKYFFGKYAEIYFQKLYNERSGKTIRVSKYDMALRKLPKKFNTADVMKAFDVSINNARVIIHRLKKAGQIFVDDNFDYVKL